MNDKIKAEEAALEFVQGLMKQMALECGVEASTDRNSYVIGITGRDVGIIIGRRGETLDAVQYLASVVAGNVGRARKRLVVDAEGYRDRRSDQLTRLAEQVAQRVLERNRAERLDPMNSFERLLIHKHLSEQGQVVTKSEGREPRRYIVIEPPDYVAPKQNDPYERTGFNKSGGGRKPRSFGNKKRFF